MAIKGDTAVVGVGVLGKHLCRMILEDSSTSSRVVGVTQTRNNHESIRADIGHHHHHAGDSDDRFQLITNEDVAAAAASSSKKLWRRFDNVVFCAPPSGFTDYPLAVRTAMDQLWAGPDHGVFVFTSSGAV
jgi:nucleoside-diphosphate-sugar epimerase